MAKEAGIKIDNCMKVMKFGGTSVGSVNSILSVKQIVEAVEEPVIVVVSALGGITDKLINTSLSTLIVLLCIFVLGGDSIRSFAFAMILGVVIGTLSSIFIAAPIAYLTMGNKMPEETKA